MSDPSLTARYNAPKKFTLTKRWRVILIVVVLALGVAAAAFIALDKYNQLQAQDVEFHVLSNREAVAVVEVDYNSKQRVQCDIRAMNESYAVVGFKTVVLPESDTGGMTKQRLTVPLRTDNLATTAGVESCYVVPKDFN